MSINRGTGDPVWSPHSPRSPGNGHPLPLAPTGSAPTGNAPSVAPDGRPLDGQPIWRREYPVDWPESEYVSRREFTRLLLVTSFAFVAGQVYVLTSSLLRQRQAPPAPAQIASVADVPVGTTRLFYYPGENNPCVLVRLSQDEYVAYSQKCTHLSCPVIPDPATGRIRCPCHEGLYDLRTGAVLAGPPERPLPRITLEIKEGRILATGIQGGAL